MPSRASEAERAVGTMSDFLLLLLEFFKTGLFAVGGGLATIPFLCIDEVGRIKNTEAVQDWFSYILDKRHSEGLPFMLIGNLHFKKDCKDGGCPKCFENYFDNETLFEKEDIKKLRLGVVGALPHESDDSRYGVSTCKNLFKRSVIMDKNLKFLSYINYCFRVPFIFLFNKAIKLHLRHPLKYLLNAFL